MGHDQEVGFLLSLKIRCILRHWTVRELSWLTHDPNMSDDTVRSFAGSLTVLESCTSEQSGPSGKDLPLNGKSKRTAPICFHAMQLLLWSTPLSGDSAVCCHVLVGHAEEQR